MDIKSLTGSFDGATAFLIGGGPSFKEIDHEKLRLNGIVTVGMNNTPATFRPNIWIGVDTPSTFLSSVWLDPTITKFIPKGYRNSSILYTDSSGEKSKKIYSLPNVVRFKLNNIFDVDNFFLEETVNYGNSSKSDGARSVLLASIKILYLLGFKKVYLLGVDFKMNEGAKNYHYDEDSNDRHVLTNNESYKINNDRLSKLAEIMKHIDFEVFNCNKSSNLKAFDYINIDSAIKDALDGFPDVEKESSLGLYEKASKERIDKKKRTKRYRKNNVEENIKPLHVKNQIVLTGISRSGNHAVLNWIASQYTGNVELRNNLWRHISSQYLHDPSNGRAPKHWYSLPNLPYKKSDDSIDTFIYSYENQNGARFGLHDSVLSDSSKKIVLLRDPFNLLSSSYEQVLKGSKFWFYKVCCDDRNVNIEKLDKFYKMWMSHSDLCDREDVITILYNKWFSDADYRNSIADELCVDNRTDESMMRVPVNGGGSSFDSTIMDGNACNMKVLNRVDSIRELEWFKYFVNKYPDLVDKSNSIFGKIL